MYQPVLSGDTHALSSREWLMILNLDPLSEVSLDYLVGSTGPWRVHCDRFKRSRVRRIALVRKMPLPQQCQFYRRAAFIQMGQS